ncbi:3278_t:CDS:2 [Funneliformis caledonium]|uniref:3278_t:CDS:1 n=2 Tax=Funneliformis TaxID=1117308 RepID=A0A9N9GY39_9GLOM|nr:5294_t:CDS:2 [Funneliformis mosseae]CAG8634996.1 3278_t:CDS:2 [Funneliformis caledonium]
MPTLATYSLITLLFTISYTFTLLSLLLPNWLLFSTPKPFRTYTNIGLFKRCSNTIFNDECRPFPSSDYNDCEEKFFCEEWGLAVTTMILAAILGGLTWLNFVLILLGGRLRREKAWKNSSGLLLLHALFQFITIFLIAHIYTTSEKFYFGVKYDYSFIFANISACLSVLLSLTLFTNGLFSPPEYHSF